MFNWFKRKEVFREICIPTVFLDNNIDFSYQHTIEIATIDYKGKRVLEDVAHLIQEYDIKSLKELSNPDLKKDSIKVYNLIGSQETKRMLIAILDPVKKGQDPKLIAYNLIDTGNQRSVMKLVNF